jgi:hypothetical protein
LDLNIPQAIWDALTRTLDSWATGLSDQATVGVQQDLTTLVGWLKSVNFITTLPPDIVNLLANKIGLQDIMPLLNALTGTALLFAAVSYAGHAIFGWPGIGQGLQRIGIGIILVKASVQLTDWSIQFADAMTQGLAATLPDAPQIPSGANPVLLAFCEAIWVFLMFRLVLAAGKLIVWLMVLKPVAGLAFIAYMFNKSEWITLKWVEMWSGLLVGHFLLVLALAGSVLLVTRGGFQGFVLSCAGLMVAREAMFMFTPKGGSPLFKVGPVEVG